MLDANQTEAHWPLWARAVSKGVDQLWVFPARVLPSAALKPDTVSGRAAPSASALCSAVGTLCGRNNVFSSVVYGEGGGCVLRGGEGEQ